jgi:hypothetical protein
MTDKLLMNIMFSLLVFLSLIPVALSANTEKCHNSLKELMKNSNNVESMQKLLGLQGKLTLHRLSWALTSGSEGKENFKIENKIDSLLSEMIQNKDPQFIEAKKIYESNKLSRTGLARIMPFLRNILNKQNEVTDSRKRNKYLIQESDLKLMSILAENEEFKGGKFNATLLSDTNSLKSVLNFVKVINSSMRQREVSQSSKEAITNQINIISKEIEHEISNLPLSRPCMNLFINKCGPIRKNASLSVDLFELIDGISDFETQKELKYDDFWLHVGRKEKYLPDDVIIPSTDVSLPSEQEIPLNNENDYFNKVASYVLSKYPYFTSRQDLLNDKELLFSLAESLNQKKFSFTHNGRVYQLPNNYNSPNFIDKGKDIHDSIYNIPITPMDRKLNLPHVKMIDKSKSELIALKKLIPIFESLDKDTTDRDSKIKKLEDEFYYMLITATKGKPTRSFIDFHGAIYDSKTGKKLDRSKESLLSYPLDQTSNKGPYSQYKNLPQKQKEAVILTANDESKSYIYQEKIYSLTNDLMSQEEVISKETKTPHKSIDKVVSSFLNAPTPEDVNKAKLKLAKSIIEKEKTLQLGVNVINPLTLRISSITEQQQTIKNFQIGNNIPQTNPLSLNYQTRINWFQAIKRNKDTFKDNGENFNSLTGEVMNETLSRTPSGMVNYGRYKSLEEKLNLLDDKNLIIEYHKNFQAEGQCDYYTIVDKQRNKLSVYNKQGEELLSKEILLGELRGDKRTQFFTEDYIKGSRKTNKITGAGVFYSYDFRNISDDDYYKFYNGNLLALVTEKGASDGLLNKDNLHETVLAIHQTPVGMEYRNPKFNNNRNDDNRATNGCLNLTQADFEEYKDKFPSEGCPVYILPEELKANGSPINRMKIHNGKISFTPVDRNSCDQRAAICDSNYFYSPHAKEEIKEIDLIVMNPEHANNPIVNQFIKTLESEKLDLAKKLNLSSNEYNDLAQLSYAILGIESGFGLEDRYSLKEGSTVSSVGKALSLSSPTNIHGLFQKIQGWIMQDNAQEISQTIVSGTKMIKGNDSKNSRGLTQIKDVLSYTKNLYPEITEDNLTEPRNAAIATVIVLKEMSRRLNKVSSGHNNINKENRAQFLYYIYNGSSSQVKNGNATPGINIRSKEIKEYLDQIQIYQK